MLLKLGFLLLTALRVVSGNIQTPLIPLNFDGPTNPANDSAQKLHLSTLGVDGFTHLQHSRYPNHRVRIKKSTFCDPTVKWAFSVSPNPGLNVVPVFTPDTWTSMLAPNTSSFTFSKAGVILIRVGFTFTFDPGSLDKLVRRCYDVDQRR